jgi:hypothetical protein
LADGARSDPDGLRVPSAEEHRLRASPAARHRRSAARVPAPLREVHGARSPDRPRAEHPRQPRDAARGSAPAARRPESLPLQGVEARGEAPSVPREVRAGAALEAPGVRGRARMIERESDPVGARLRPDWMKIWRAAA